MTSPDAPSPNFLRDLIKDPAKFNTPQKQDIQKRALKWLQLHITNDLADKTILEQFAKKWRVGKNQYPSSDRSPLSMENLPGSYKGEQSISRHQEDALDFLQDVIPLEIQEGFKQRWNANIKLEVSNAMGAAFKINDQDMELLQQDDPDGNGTTWYQVENKQVYYLLSSEPKGDDYLIVLGEEISPRNQNTWFVAQEHVKISNC